MERIYNKLVRDKIPDIIRGNKEIPITYVLKDEEFKRALETKLKEEYDELLRAADDNNYLEELADILEVIEALAKSRLSSLEEILKIKENKVLKRGAFDEKIFLEKVIEQGWDNGK